MNIHADIKPTLETVLLQLSAQRNIEPKKKENMISALRSLEKWAGMPLRDIPADIPTLRAKFETVSPHALGINPKTLANVKSLCRRSIAVSGLVKDVELKKPRISANPQWRDYWELLPSKRLRTALQGLASWASREKLAPQYIDNEAVARFMAYRHETSLRDNQYRFHRATAKAWNEAVDFLKDLTLSKVDIPPSRLRKKHIPMEFFPASLWEEWNAFARWAHGEDMFGDDARPKPLAHSSLDCMQRRIHVGASTLAKTGVDPSTIRSLRDLVEIEAFRTILAKRFEEVGRKPNHENHFIARNLIEIARDAVKVTPEHLASLKAIAKKLPQPRMDLSEKNHRALTRFDDPDVLQRLVAAPDAIWRNAMANPRKTRSWFLAELQAAIGIGILINMPIRLGNLTELTFDKHLLLRKQGTSTLMLLAEETKTGHQLQFDIPSELAARMIDYRYELAPKVLGKVPDMLFVNREGETKGLASVRYLITRYLKLYVGVHINPHLFRHLAAKLILDEAPGAHVLAQHLLGHKKLETTATYYAGFNTRRAARHHQKLLRNVLEGGRLEPARRGR